MILYLFPLGFFARFGFDPPPYPSLGGRAGASGWDSGAGIFPRGGRRLDQAAVKRCFSTRRVSWIRHREKRTLPRQPWAETVTEFRSRLKGICEHINANHDVEGLCRGFPGRFPKVIDAQGDRIGK